MGLLNDATKNKKISTFLVDHYRKGILLSYLFGILWVVSLSSESVNIRAYFSENALLPGVVTRDFNPGSSLSNVLEGLKEEVNNHFSGIPITWIQGQFRQIGLDVYTQNFTLHYPFGSKPTYTGINIYAILRAPKSSSTEALVLSTPYRGLDSIHKSTLPSLALMIELAKYFRRHTYWSKDIIFLITEHEMIGFQAWLNAYHNVAFSDSIESGSLNSYSGLIQGVINLEINSERISSIDMKIEGLNGQLPNLDLFNLAVELCARESATVTFQTRKTYYNSGFSLENLQYDLLTMLSMMALQSTGLTNGGHGLFHRYGIQAITLTSTNNGPTKISLIHVGRVLEGIFRSLNNLLEKFHQSFFFYLLPSTRRFVSIGLYMPPFSLIAFPVLIKAVYLFVETKFSLSKFGDLEKLKLNVNLWFALDIVIISYLLGIITYSCPSLAESFQKVTRFSLEDSIYYTHFITLIIFIFFLYFYCKKKTLTKGEYYAKLCVTLLGLGGFLYSLSLINISMAIALALIYAPISILVEFKNKFYFIPYLYLLIINPFTVVYFIVVGQSLFNDKYASWYEHIVLGLTGHKKFLLYTIEDMYLFNNWNYKIATLALLPIWFQLWMLMTFSRSQNNML